MATGLPTNMYSIIALLQSSGPRNTKSDSGKDALMSEDALHSLLQLRKLIRPKFSERMFGALLFDILHFVWSETKVIEL